MRGKTLSQQILSANDGSIFFRTDFPQYHPESVGRTLSGLVEEGALVRIASGVYLKPKQSKYGAIMPSVDKIVQAIAERDKAQVLPSGVTALNALGLSTQVPMTHSFLTTGSARTLYLGDRKVILKRAVPRNFAYSTQLIPLLVQALKSLGEQNIDEEILSQMRELINQEKEVRALTEDVAMMPAWMQRIVKPMLNE